MPIFNFTSATTTKQLKEFTELAQNSKRFSTENPYLSPILESNSNDPEFSWTTWEIILTTIPMSLLVIEIILGNLLVIISILTQTSLRIPSNIFILSLAIADLAVGVFILPLNITDMIKGWIFGKVLCKIWLTLDVTLCASSILHISAIAVDRFRIINEGITYAQSQTIKMSILVCGCLWLIALWIASAPVLGWNDWDWENIPSDAASITCAHTRKLGFVIYSVVGTIFIPAIIMIALYFRIYMLIRNKLRDRAKLACAASQRTKLILKKRSVLVSNIPEENESVNDMENGFLNDNTMESLTPETSRDLVNCDNEFKVGKKHSQQIEKILKDKLKISLTKEHKAAKTLGFIIGAFIICWTPFTLIYIASGVLLQVYKVEVIPFWLFQTVSWLGFLNSGLNPIIYTVYSADFRRAFTNILKIFCCRK